MHTGQGWLKKWLWCAAGPGWVSQLSAASTAVEVTGSPVCGQKAAVADSSWALIAWWAALGTFTGACAALPKLPTQRRRDFGHALLHSLLGAEALLLQGSGGVFDSQTPAHPDHCHPLHVVISSGSSCLLNPVLCGGVARKCPGPRGLPSRGQPRI